MHRAYIEAGAQLIRTNTFAVNSMFFQQMKSKRC
ncbi:MAG: homocysteine S-methyltransferase family protein [Coprococcus sp.]